MATATPPPPQPPPPPPANMHHGIDAAQIIILNDGYQTVRGAQLGNLKSFAQTSGGAPPTSTSALTLERHFGGPGSPLIDGDLHRTGVVRPVVFASPTLRHSTTIADNGKPAGIVIGNIF